MATINPRVDQDKNVIGWQAIIRKRGFPSQTKTFRTKRDAESWAKIIESEMVRGVFIQRNDAERTLLSDALSRYM
ncbi:MAG: site-specific integrase, partial [Ferrimicrobium sp.]